MISRRHCFYFIATATSEIYSLSYTTLFRSEARPLLDAQRQSPPQRAPEAQGFHGAGHPRPGGRGRLPDPRAEHGEGDRKSTRLNSSHVEISYAVFCLKKKKGRIR